MDWDNKYIGDMTAVTTHGQANATIYAVGSMGTHFIDIYEGYPGAAYMNPAQHPSLQIWDPPYIPYQTTYKITSEPFTQTSSAGLGGVSVILLILSLALVVGAFVLTPVMAFQKRKKGDDFFTSAVGKIGVIAIVAALLIAGAGVYLAYNHTSKTIQSPAASDCTSGFRCYARDYCTTNQCDIRTACLCLAERCRRWRNGECYWIGLCAKFTASGQLVDSRRK